MECKYVIVYFIPYLVRQACRVSIRSRPSEHVPSSEIADTFIRYGFSVNFNGSERR